MYLAGHTEEVKYCKVSRDIYGSINISFYYTAEDYDSGQPCAIQIFNKDRKSEIGIKIIPFSMRILWFFRRITPNKLLVMPKTKDIAV